MEREGSAGLPEVRRSAQDEGTKEEQNEGPSPAADAPKADAAAAGHRDQSERAGLERKMRKALQVLLLQRGRNPGVKGWEMKRYLGRDYKKITEILSEELKPLGLEIFVVPGIEPTEDSARYILRFRETPTLTEFETAGYRIDDLAVLAATIAFVNAKQGRVSRKEVEHFLREKFPRWRIEYSLDRYIKRGYIDQDDKSLLRIGWRTRAEIDEKSLMTLILARGTEVPPA